MRKRRQEWQFTGNILIATFSHLVVLWPVILAFISLVYNSQNLWLTEVKFRNSLLKPLLPWSEWNLEAGILKWKYIVWGFLFSSKYNRIWISTDGFSYVPLFCNISKYNRTRISTDGFPYVPLFCNISKYNRTRFSTDGFSYVPQFCNILSEKRFKYLTHFSQRFRDFIEKRKPSSDFPV